MTPQRRPQTCKSPSSLAGKWQWHLLASDRNIAPLLIPETTVDDIQNSDDSTHASPLVQISATDDKQICLGPCKTKAPAVSTGKPAFVQSTTSVFVTKVVKAKTASFHKRQAASTHLQTEAANCIFDHPAYVTRIRRHLSRSKQPLWAPALACLYVCVCVS